MIIKDQVRAQSIAQTFSDEYSKKIILSTNIGPVSIEEISESTGIPLSTCYRRIRTLTNAGFIRLEKSESRGDSREHDCYRSVFSKMAIRIEGGVSQLKLIPSRRQIIFSFPFWLRHEYALPKGESFLLAKCQDQSKG